MSLKKFEEEYDQVSLVDGENVTDAVLSFDNLSGDDDCDYEIAYIFSEYLNNNSNNLPTFDYVDEVRNEAKITKESDTISAGQGIVVSHNMIVDYFEELPNRRERHDRITADTHEAYETSFGNENKPIDLSTDTRFNEKRVRHLQKYLSDYREQRMNKEAKARTR